MKKLPGMLFHPFGKAYMTHQRISYKPSAFKLVRFIITILLFSSMSYLHAQEKQITGIITDHEGEAIPGVTIQIKGTTEGTISDIDGKYTLANVPDSATLEYSFVGKLNENVVVNGQTTIDITLAEDIVKLDELVVIGYGTQSKRFVSGSISSVDMEEKKTLSPITNVAQALGDAAGVQFINSGRPGQDGTLLIRGQNSLGTQTDPLVVIDGIIFEGSLSDINPQDIKSVDILKDAASTAIYGSKAANGIIMITSNKGSSSKPEIRINASYGISEAERWLTMPSQDRYIQRKRDYYTQLVEVAGQEPQLDVDDVSELLNPEEYENYLAGNFRGYEDIVGRNGKLSTLDLSVAGGSEKSSYLFSGSINQDVGLILGDQQTKVSLRMNLQTEISDWLTIGITSFFTYRDLSGIQADLSDGYDDSPFGNFYYPDGNVKFNPISSEASVYNALYYYELTDNTETRKNLFSNLFFEVDFPFLKGLSFRMNYSPNLEWHNNYSFTRQDPYSAGNTTFAEKKNKNINRWVWENILKYQRTFADIHDFDLTLMYGRNSYYKEETNAEASLFEIDILGYNQFGLGNNHIIQSPAEDSYGVSSLARLNYTLMKKYIVSVAARRDGGSVFGSKNKFGVFPSIALSWIASEESFLRSVGPIDFLKLRVSYGENGNSAIDPYVTQSLNNSIYNVIGDNTASPIALVPDYTIMGNENLRWETTKSFNIGVDFGILKNRLSGTVDLYRKNTTDQILKRTIPQTNAYEATYDNVGEVSNKGIELTLNSLNVDASKFSWRTAFSFAYNKNEIIHLFGDVDGDGIEDDYPINGWFIGQNINAYYDYEFDGIHQENAPGENPLYYAGDIRLKDNSGNDTIGVNDRAVVGHGKFPDYSFTLNNTLSYGNLSLYFSINGMFGWVAPFDLVYAHGPGRPMNSLDVDYWTPENKSNELPSLLYSNGARDNHYYISRNFVRIKDLALYYDFHNLNVPMLQKFSSLRLTLSVKNLYTFTKWLGPDPENAGTDPDGVNGNGITSNKGSDKLYPMPRLYSIGINVSF